MSRHLDLITHCPSVAYALSTKAVDKSVDDLQATVANTRHYWPLSDPGSFLTNPFYFIFFNVLHYLLQFYEESEPGYARRRTSAASECA